MDDFATEEKLYKKTLEFGLAYRRDIDSKRVYPDQSALADLDKFDEEMPWDPQDHDVVLDILNRWGAPATVAQTGGRYFGFVCGGVLPGGLAAKILGSFWDQNSALQVLSPISSKLESVTEGWINHALSLGGRFRCGFLSGSSMATFCGLAAARYRLLERRGWNLNERGLNGSPGIRVVTGKHAHSTVVKAVSLLGLGVANIENVDVDDQGRLRAAEMPKLDDTTILVLQAGNVNSGSFDDLKTIIPIAKKAGAWVHVDGAFGLWAGASPNYSHLTEGMENADSLSVDGHKTLNTSYDSGILLCGDEGALKSALHMSGSYIIPGSDRDGMYYTPEMSRRSRVIELWAVMKTLGRRGIAELVEQLCRRAKQFAEEISLIDGFHVLNDVVFNQVLVSCDNDELTVNTMVRIQDQGVCWVGGSEWFGRKAIRVSVSSHKTTEEDISLSVQSFAEALEKEKRHSGYP